VHYFGYLSNVLMHTMVAFKVPISHWLLFLSFHCFDFFNSYYLFLPFLLLSFLLCFVCIRSSFIHFGGEGGCLLSLYFVNCLVIMSLLRFISGQEEGVV